MAGIVAITLIQICVMTGGYMWFKRLTLKPVKKGRSKNYQQELDTVFWLFLVLFSGFIIRIIAAASYRGHETDMNCFIGWADMIFKDGVGKFYKSDAFTDYPPGYMYILYVIGGIRKVCGLAWDSKASIVITKLPAILADIGTGFLIYKIACKYWKKSGAAVLSALYIFCPMIILDSAVWGQTDSVFTLCIAFMCYLLTERKLIPAYFVFAIGILIKPQSLIFTPVLIFAIIDQVFLEGFEIKKFGINLGLGLCAIGMIALLMLPFGFSDAFKQYSETLGSYKYATVNADNIWALMGKNWCSQDDIFIGMSIKNWGTVFIIITVILAGIVHFRSKNNPSRYYFVAGFIVTMVFTLSVRMHERYLFPAIILFLMAYIARPRKKIFILYVAISAVMFLNSAYILFIYDVKHFDAKAVETITTSFLMLLTYVYMLVVAFTEYKGKVTEKDIDIDILDAKCGKSGGVASKKKNKKRNESSPIRPSLPKISMTKKDFIIMGVLMVVYAVIAFVRLGNNHAPVTAYSVVKEGEIDIDMGKDVNIVKLWDFLGYQNNPRYAINYKKETDANWTVLYEGQAEDEGDSYWDAGSVFSWNSKDLNITARYIKISAGKDNTNDSIHEIIFEGKDGKILKPENANDYPNLFDEQDEFDGRKSYLNGTYFDEIYHGRTAYEMIHHLYCYENTHPPLGKIFIAAGVLMFGMNPFGWRFMGTLFGVFMVPVIYLFAKKMFKETWLTAVTAILFTFDFMHFVQTRIATIDVFVTLFIMLSYYFMYCYTRMSFYDTELKKTFIPLGLCGISMGLSIASKWTGIYSAAGLAVIFFAQMIKRYIEYRYAVMHPGGNTEGISHSDIRKTFGTKFIKTILFCCIVFVVVPVIIYLLSYIPFNDGSDRGFLEKVINAQKTMYDYHSKLDAEHPYSSWWYQWPIMQRPIWYYSGITGKLHEGISAFGNPLVWWVGMPATAYMLYLLIRYRDRKSAFLLLGYLSQYAPWFLVTRIVFIYHYFPSVPFVTLMLGHAMYNIAGCSKRDGYVPFKQLGKRKRNTIIAAFVYAALAVGLFAMFYPVLSALPIHPEYAEKYLKWFDSWVLLDTWTK